MKDGQRNRIFVVSTVNGGCNRYLKVDEYLCFGPNGLDGTKYPSGQSLVGPQPDQLARLLSRFSKSREMFVYSFEGEVDDCDKESFRESLVKAMVDRRIQGR